MRSHFECRRRKYDHYDRMQVAYDRNADCMRPALRPSVIPALVVAQHIIANVQNVFCWL